MGAIVGQFTFGGGQINRGLIGRRDLQKYYQSTFLINNFVVKRHGTLEKRHGFKQAHTFSVASSEEVVRVIPMTWTNEACNYLVFSTTSIYVFDREGMLVDTIVNSPYNTKEIILALEYAQSGDTIFIASRKVRPKRLRRMAENDFQLDDMPFDDFLKDDLPTVAVNTKEWTKADSSRKRDIQYRVTEVIGGKEIRVSEPVEVNVYMPPAEGSFTTLTMMSHHSDDEAFEGFNIYRNDGSGWGYIGTTVGTGDNSFVSGNEIAIGFGSNWTEAEAGGSWSVSTQLNMPSDVERWLPERVRCVIFTGAEMFEADADNEGKIKRKHTGSMDFSYSATIATEEGPRSAGSGVAYLGTRLDEIVDAVNDNGTYTDATERLQAAGELLAADGIWDVALSGNAPEEAEAFAGAMTVKFTISGMNPAPTGKAFDGTLEYGAPETRGWNSRFVDNYIQLDYSQSIPTYRQPFEKAGDYPGVVSLYQQRMIWGSTDNDPSMFWMSVPGDMSNFSVHTNIQDDDMINAALPLTRGPKILHAISHKYLIFLCENSECVVRSDGGLTYKSIISEQQSYTGSSERVKPLVCGNAILFADRAGASAREYKYDYTLDAMAGRDVSVLNSEMFGRTGGVVDWCYQMFPDSLVWCVMEDGSLGIFCYMPEQDVYAWSQATLPATAISIACGDALEEGDGTTGAEKMSSMAVLTKDGDAVSLWVFDAGSFVDTLKNGGQSTIVGDVELVVPDSGGELEPLRKRLIGVSIRGRNMENMTIGAIDRDAEVVGVPEGENIYERDKRIEGEIAEVQLQGDWGFDSRIRIKDDGAGRTEILCVVTNFDAANIGF